MLTVESSKSQKIRMLRVFLFFSFLFVSFLFFSLSTSFVFGRFFVERESLRIWVCFVSQTFDAFAGLLCLCCLFFRLILNHSNGETGGADLKILQELENSNCCLFLRKGGNDSFQSFRNGSSCASVLIAYILTPCISEPTEFMLFLPHQVSWRALAVGSSTSTLNLRSSCASGLYPS